MTALLYLLVCPFNLFNQLNSLIPLSNISLCVSKELCSGPVYSSVDSMFDLIAFIRASV